MDCVYMINKVNKNVKRIINYHLSNEGIGYLQPTHFMILITLLLNEGKMKTIELSKSIGKERSTTTTVVNRLVEKGYVTKNPSNLDRRVVYIVVTSKTKDIEQHLFQVATNTNNDFISAFSDDALPFVKRIFSQANQNLENLLSV